MGVNNLWGIWDLLALLWNFSPFSVLMEKGYWTYLLATNILEIFLVTW